MAQSKRKKKAQARNKAEGKKFWTTVFIVTGVLLILLFIIFTRAVG